MNTPATKTSKSLGKKPRKLPSAGKSTSKRKNAATDAATPSEPPIKRTTKLEQVIALIRRPEGATVDDLTAATGWQAHSVRGAIAGSIKKKLELKVTTEKVEGRGTVYRIAGGQE